MNLNNCKQNASKRKKYSENEYSIIVHKINGKICSPIEVQISKEKQILKLAF